MKWILVFVLIAALAFAAGLRIDFQVLDRMINQKTDPAVEELMKMGVDPGQVPIKQKSWWTFKTEDNLFRHLTGWNPVKQLSDQTWEATQTMKAKLGPSQAEVMQSQAQAMQAQMRERQRMAQQMAEQS